MSWEKNMTGWRLILVLSVVVGVGTLSGPALLQERLVTGANPYQVVEDWMQPFADGGYAWGAHSAVYAESPDRIFVSQRGEIRLPDPVPPGFNGFAGSIGVNLFQLDDGQRTWRNVLFVVDGEGNMIETWSQWDELFGDTPADDPPFGGGPHKIRINQYDPERRVWVVNSNRHVIYAFSNDGNELLMTLGEAGVAGTDESHFSLPQDIAFMDDGSMFVVDGWGGNERIVKFDAAGSYVTHWGKQGPGRGEFDTPHAIATDIRGNIYIADRGNNRIQVFNQTTRSTWYHPNISPIGTWPDLESPVEIYITGYDVWVAGATYVVKLDVNGNRLFTYNLDENGPGHVQQLHQFSVDSEGAVYVADNTLGRTQKFLPSGGAAFTELLAAPNPPLQ